MIEAKFDSSHMRMNITINQALTAQEMKVLIEQIELETSGLERGWTAAVDMRGMWVSDPFITSQFMLLQDALINCGAGKIGTLLDNDAVRMHLGQAGQKTQSNKITQRFYDPQKWEQFLASSLS